MDISSEVNVYYTAEQQQNVDRINLKEERKLKNRQKKAAKKLNKQKEREQKELILKLQIKSNNVTLITRDLADQVVGKAALTKTFSEQTVNNADFPALGARYKVRSLKNDSFSIATAGDEEKKKLLKVELSDFLYMPSTSKNVKPIVQTSENYDGNPLDADMPIRKRGKYREEPKIKKLSKLKREIIKDKSEYEQDLPEMLSVVDINLCNNNVTQELNTLVTTFLSAIVGLQDKLYKRDPVKGKYKRRYVVGIHETKKYLNLNKVKMLIMAPDIKIIKEDGAINCAIKEIIDLAKANNTTYLFALKRRSMGVLTLKYIPVSSIAVLNYEGLEEYYNNILKILPSVKTKEHSCDENIAKDEANQKFLNNLMEALKCDN